jgi:hypothetical protein
MKRPTLVSLFAIWWEGVLKMDVMIRMGDAGAARSHTPCNRYTGLYIYLPTLRMCVRCLTESQKVTYARLSNHSSREPWSMNLNYECEAEGTFRIVVGGVCAVSP